ncbi:hypothetical protein [Halomicrobium katesii]|uniref:hypothetical protein n=1 Tax=Halomicrobium katesii TaxID=437163 RepID=UPI0003697138|nr:hypothetical protein [Halomicrobium katesii]
MEVSENTVGSLYSSASDSDIVWGLLSVLSGLFLFAVISFVIVATDASFHSNFRWVIRVVLLPYALGASVLLLAPFFALFSRLSAR